MQQSVRLHRLTQVLTDPHLRYAICITTAVSGLNRAPTAYRAMSPLILWATTQVTLSTPQPQDLTPPPHTHTHSPLPPPTPPPHLRYAIRIAAAVWCSHSHKVAGPQSTHVALIWIEQSPHSISGHEAPHAVGYH